MGLVKATGEFFRELLDTHGRIATLGAIIVACGGGTLVAAISQSLLHIHGLFIWAIGLIVSGALVVFSAHLYQQAPTYTKNPIPNTRRRGSPRIGASTWSGCQCSRLQL